MRPHVVRRLSQTHRLPLPTCRHFTFTTKKHIFPSLTVRCTYSPPLPSSFNFIIIIITVIIILVTTTLTTPHFFFSPLSSSFFAFKQPPASTPLPQPSLALSLSSSSFSVPLTRRHTLSVIPHSPHSLSNPSHHYHHHYHQLHLKSIMSSPAVAQQQQHDHHHYHHRRRRPSRPRPVSQPAPVAALQPQPQQPSSTPAAQSVVHRQPRHQRPRPQRPVSTGSQGGGGGGGGTTTATTAVAPASSSSVTPAPVASTTLKQKSYPMETAPTKKQVGNAGWTLIHSIAANYPEHPSESDRYHASAFLTSIGKLYPCKRCRRHFERYIVASPPELSSKQVFMLWACRAHNDVNRRNNKREFPCTLHALEQRWGDCGCTMKAA